MSLRLAGKVVTALVACLFLVVLVDFLAALVSPAAWDLNDPLRAGPKVRRDPWQRLEVEREQEQSGVLIHYEYERSLTVEVEDDRLTATYVLTASRDDRLLQLVQSGQADNDPDSFVQYALGAVMVAEIPAWLPESLPREGREKGELDFEAPIVVAQAQSNKAEVHVRSRPYELFLPKFRVTVNGATLSASKDQLTVSGKRVAIRTGEGVRPEWQTESVVSLSRPVEATISFDVERRDLPTVQSRLVTLGTVTLPVVGNLLITLMDLVPLLVLLYFLVQVEAKRVGIPQVMDWRRIVALLIMWQLSVAIVDTAVELDARAGAYLERLTSRLLDPPDDGIPLVVGPYGLGIVAALLLWPVAVARRSTREAAGPSGAADRPLLHRALWAVLVASALGIVLVSIELSERSALATHPVWVVACVLTVVGIFLASLLLVRAALGRRRVASVAAAATLGFVLVAMLSYLLLWPDGEQVNLFAVVAFWLLAAVFMVTFAVLAWSVVDAVLERRRQRESQREEPEGRVRSRSRRAVWGILVLLVLIPAVGLTLPLQQADDIGPWTAFRFAYALPWLSGWLGLVYLLLVLESLPDASLPTDTGERHQLIRWAGIVFAIFTFYWPSQHWLYIPVTIILGLILAAKFLLPRTRIEQVAAVEAAAQAAAAAAQAAAAAAEPAMGQQGLPLRRALRIGQSLLRRARRTSQTEAAAEPAGGQHGPPLDRTLRMSRNLLDAALRISQAEEALRARRASLAKAAAGKEAGEGTNGKPAGGEDGTEAVDIQRLERRLREAEAAFPVKIKGKSAKQIALGLAPSVSPWQNGWLAARYGFYIGAPWLLLYLWELGSSPGTLGEGTLLGFLGEAAWIVLQWALFGFFFGYFYPYIRGDNGIAKGCCLFVTIVLPPLAYHAMTMPWSAWPSSGVLLFTLQVLLFSLVLGLLAGDLTTLWRVKLGWPQLVQLQNLRFFVTFASSLAVAGGAAVATWISTGATLLTTVMDRITPPTGPSSPAGP